MRQLFIIMGLLAVLAVAPPARAQGTLLLNVSTSHIDISENSGHEKITLNYVVSQTGENALQDSIYVYGTISGVSVRDEVSELTPSENVEGGFTVIRYDLRKAPSPTLSTVTVEFQKPTAATDGGYRYAIGYLWSTTPNGCQIIATLSEEYTLSETPENTSSISSENNKLQLMWSKAQENQFYTAITFEKKSTAPENQDVGQPAEISSLSYVLILAAAAASLATAGAFLKVRPLKPRIKVPPKVKRPQVFRREDIRRILRLLTEHERKVVGALLKKDNLTQRVLCDRTGIPKATMSRVLQRLEGKGIITREGFGVSKRVLLTKWARRWKK